MRSRSDIYPPRILLLVLFPQRLPAHRPNRRNKTDTNTTTVSRLLRSRIPIPTNKNVNMKN